MKPSFRIVGEQVIVMFGERIVATLRVETREIPNDNENHHLDIKLRLDENFTTKMVTTSY